MKVNLEGRVIEIMKKNDSYIYRIFQVGERELVEVISKENTVEEGDGIRCSGRLSVTLYKGRIYTKVYADEIETVYE